MAIEALHKIVQTAANFKTNDEKVRYLRMNNTMAMRTIMQIFFDDKLEWNIPTTPPAYTPLPYTNAQGVLYKQIRVVKYLFKGLEGDALTPQKRQTIFLNLLEGVDSGDASMLIDMLQKKAPKGLNINIVNEALGLNIEHVEKKSKKSKKS